MINIIKKVIIGIYKITSPSGKIYVGQAININKRWNIDYKSLNCKGQPKIYHSLLKYGYESHKFEVIQECSLEQLNKLEIHWKQYYLYINNWNWDRVLFCELYDAGGGPRSEITKQKIREKAKGHKRNIGRKHSKESIRKMSISAEGNIKKSGYIMPEESKKIIGVKNKHPKPVGFGYNKHKIVNQYDLQGNFLKEWKGSEAKKLFKGDITSCCSGRQKTAGGFKWKYK